MEEEEKQLKRLVSEESEHSFSCSSPMRKGATTACSAHYNQGMVTLETKGYLLGTHIYNPY